MECFNSLIFATFLATFSMHRTIQLCFEKKKIKEKWQNVAI